MSYKDFSRDLRKNAFHNVIVLYGKENFLMRWAVDQICNKYAGKKFRKENVMDLAGNEVEVQEIIGMASTPSMFGGQRVILVRNFPSMKKEKKQQKEGEEKEKKITREEEKNIVTDEDKNKAKDTKKAVSDIYDETNKLEEEVSILNAVLANRFSSMSNFKGNDMDFDFNLGIKERINMGNDNDEIFSPDEII